jgi:hypothetical protein
MKKLVVVGSLLSLVLTGCSSDEREGQISKTISELNKAASSLGNIRDNVEKWEKETKDSEKNRFLKQAMDGTETLKSVAQQLQLIKQTTDKLEPATKEQKEEYAQKHRNALGSALNNVNKEQTALNEALTRAEAANRNLAGALGELKQKLQLAQGEFEVLTKTR